MKDCSSPRVLIVDDVRSIHHDFQKVLCPETDHPRLRELEESLFTAHPRHVNSPTFRLDHAYQGVEAEQLVRASLESADRYAVAFVDMRMPPGWDGVETIEHVWAADPNVQVVICSAHSDRDWGEVLARLGQPDKVLVLKKPFETVEILQSTTALSRKWSIERDLREQMHQMELAIVARTQDLEHANELLRDEIKHRTQVESELGLVQKLEAVGRLASGIAHEINTPIQYIGDSVYFLTTAFEEVTGFIDAQARALAAGAGPGADQAAAREYLESIDLAFLREEIPRAIARTAEGANRVGQIVRAMKEFAHPVIFEKSLADVNHALETTIVIAHNELKYVATVETDFGDIPQVNCNVSELNQVFLNILVNAAHALAEAGKVTTTGRILVSTRQVGRSVEIKFADNGAGISKDVINKIYDPYFTTKPIGRGSGQGLAIARTIVVDKHGGRIEVESERGQGTCFTLTLPMDEPAGAGVTP